MAHDSRSASEVRLEGAILGFLAALIGAAVVKSFRQSPSPATSGLGGADPGFRFPSAPAKEPIVQTATVSSDAKLILPRGKTARKVTLSADGPVRVDTSPAISAVRGFLLPANTRPWEYPGILPGSVELWAIRVGADDAIVSLVVQNL